MKLQMNHFSEEFKLKVVQEYLNTNVSQRELMRKHNIGGKNISVWIRKFGLVAPSKQQMELQRTMAKQNEKTPYERELEAKVKKLEQQLDYEQLRTLALDTMIDIAERDLKISIRKKSGAKR